MPHKPTYAELEAAHAALEKELKVLVNAKTSGPFFNTSCSDLPADRLFYSQESPELEDIVLARALADCKTGLWYFDFEKQKFTPDESFIRMLGFRPGQDMGTAETGSAFIHQEDEILLKETVQNFLTYRTSQFEIELRAVDSQGEIRWLLFRACPVKKGEKTTSVTGTAVDITDKKKDERYFKECEQRLETLLGNIAGIAFRCRFDGKWYLDFVSSGCMEFIGCRPEDLTENYENYRKLIHPEDRDHVWERIEQAIADKKNYELVYRMVTAGGETKWVWERGCGVFSPAGKFRSLEGLITDVTTYKNIEQELQKENIRLKSMVKTRHSFGKIVGKSQAMQKVYDMILKAAASSANVIIYGDSGTGKELVARAVHDMSERGDKRFVSVNCGAIPDNLLESEFFGYKKGAFTGAAMDKPGFLDLADKGTLFLDEIGEINTSLQVKLLRAIEGGGYTPIGGNKVKRPDLRIVAATHQNLKESVRMHRMRQDFFYRVHIIPIYLPPLNQRRSDIPLLIYHFLQMDSEEGAVATIPEDVIRDMQNYDWPGNVRELQNMIQRYITLKKVDFINLEGKGVKKEKTAPHRPEPPQDVPADFHQAMKAYEKNLIRSALETNDNNRTKTAKYLKIGLRTLQRKISEF